MRCLSRNKQRVYYALSLGKVPMRDADGNLTGEYELQYDFPCHVMANVSAARGAAEAEQFGITEQYSKTLTMDECPFEEDSILWVGKTPRQGTHNYVVTRIAKSLNSVTVAIKEVELSV